ncbi:FAD-dependent oxidoreductase [Natrialbaceae archaeon AArc-T1-2]|uniref:FAD-dependent oxidoreductase n=1 Tax=Natrialbaceae archaeon AArc-T1-2 TaxID=3053904 RepID=UPI00255B1C88|nr:FAD-dependent oxidoreductase [Natrialbaceae archaeon AArc-T1-2]WIV65774.1 FAD-dependent oxidoreductase [Natrialbaceae archaeon AArc-T1-2]
MHDEFTRGSGSLPGEATSPWLATTADAGYDALEGDLAVDVAVVGAGIAGLSTAAVLDERGASVAVLERDRIATGITGKTTAKVTSQHGLIYDHVRREFGRKRARQYAEVNEAAIETVADRIDDLEVDCGFRRAPAYVYGDDRDAIEREVDAAQGAGLPASFVTSVPPFDRATCAVRFEDQACFHPRKYLLALADALSESGVELYEHTRVTDVDPGSPCRLETPDGMVTADHVVLATGFPVLDRAGYFARLHPKRSYVLGLRTDADPPSGMYYDASEPYRSVRTHRDADGTLVLVGGENHKTGQGGSAVERYRRLERWARDRFPVESIDYRWSTQDYVPADKVPLIGRAGPTASNVYVATGFRGWGMTSGVAAGRLLADAIDGVDRPALDLYDPLRFTPKTSVADTVTENADAASQFATDWARTLLSPDRESIGRGEGRVIRERSKPIAAARDDDGDLHTVSAVCTHMYCLLEWNDAEASWDCPCHGSRFSPDGEVLEGPATDDLTDVDPGLE